jgi:hypothetical protein
MRTMLPRTGDIEYRNDWAFVWFLVVTSTLAVALSVKAGQAIGTYFYWGVLALLLAFKLLTRKLWHGFLVLLTALATLSVYQGGVIIGYRAWFYITMILGFVALFRLQFSQVRRQGIIFWFMLLMLGTFHLFFVDSTTRFLYSRGQIVYMATGLSSFAITCFIARYYQGKEYLRMFSLLIFAVCTLSLLVPQKLSAESRIGIDLNMDPNGLGSIAIYAILFGLLYLSLFKSRAALFIVPGLIVVGLALIKTGSRNSITTAIVLLGLYLLTDMRIKKSIVNFVLIACVFAGLTMLSESSQLDYLSTRFEKATGKEGKIDRLDHLIVAGAMALDEPLGMGGGGFKENYNEYSAKTGRATIFKSVDPHNLFGMALADWGVPGIFLLLAGFVGVGIGIRNEGGRVSRFKMLALVAFVMLANAGMNLSPVFMSLFALNTHDES